MNNHENKLYDYNLYLLDHQTINHLPGYVFLQYLEH